MEANVTLIIKAANQSVADHRLECDFDWTVLLLKNHLADAHPSKPSVKEQRLIYSGQLLVDHLVLRNVLRHPSENNSYTIHLVCSPPRNSTTTTTTTTTTTAAAASASAAAATVTPSANMATAASSTPPANVPVAGSSSGPTGSSSNPTPSESTSQSTESSTDGVRRRFVSPEVSTSTSTTTTNIGGPTPYINPAAQFPQELITSGDPMHQMAVMQQMYAQYMTSYMQYMQMGGAVSGMMWPGQMLQPAAPMAPPPNPQATVATAATTATEPQEPLRVDANAQPQPQPQQQQQQQQPQIRMNAQGGEVDEEDEGEEGIGRDWLDWVYMASRCAVLLSIVYFYSTPSRFMLVICIAMLLYLYQAGWFRPARRIEVVQQQPREGNNNNINRNDNNNQDDRNNNINNNNNNNLVNEVQQDRNIPDVEVEENTDDQNPPNNDTSDTVVEEIPARPSFLALSWTFLTTFFTSLIPEQPQIV